MPVQHGTLNVVKNVVCMAMSLPVAAFKNIDDDLQWLLCLENGRIIYKDAVRKLEIYVGFTDFSEQFRGRIAIFQSDFRAVCVLCCLFYNILVDVDGDGLTSVGDYVIDSLK